MKTLLLAVSKQTHPMLERVLMPHFDVVSCFTLDEARRALASQRHIDVVLCGMHFDDSRMFDLLDYIRKEAGLMSLPIVCIKVIKVMTPEGVYEAVKSAAKVKGAEFFNYRAVQDAYGEQQANVELLQILEAAILSKLPSPTCSTKVP